MWESEGTALHVECDRIVGNRVVALFVEHFAGLVEEFRPGDVQSPKSF